MLISNEELRYSAQRMLFHIKEAASKGIYVRIPAESVVVFSSSKVCFDPKPIENGNISNTMKHLGDTLYRLACGRESVDGKYEEIADCDLWPLIDMLLNKEAHSLSAIEKELAGESWWNKKWRESADKRTAVAIKLRSAGRLVGDAFRLINPWRKSPKQLDKLLLLIVLVVIGNSVAFISFNSPYFEVVVPVALYALASFLFSAVVFGVVCEKKSGDDLADAEVAVGKFLSIFLLIAGVLFFSFTSSRLPIFSISHNPVLVDRSTGSFVGRIPVSSDDNFMTVDALDLFNRKVVAGMAVKSQIDKDLTNQVIWRVEYELSSEDRYLAAWNKWQSADNLKEDVKAFMDTERADVTRRVQAVIKEFGRQSAALDQERQAATNMLKEAAEIAKSDYDKMVKPERDKMRKAFDDRKATLKAECEAKMGPLSSVDDRNILTDRMNKGFAAIDQELDIALSELNSSFREKKIEMEKKAEEVTEATRQFDAKSSGLTDEYRGELAAIASLVQEKIDQAFPDAFDSSKISFRSNTSEAIITALLPTSDK